MFDPIRIYDKPAVILTQLGNGIASSDSVRRTLTDPSALSPRERETYTTQLKKSMGDNAVTDTIVDVLANPLTWLAFVAGGAMATKNFAKSGRMFMGGVEKAGFGQWAKSQWPALRFFGGLSASQELQGTRMHKLLEAIPDSLQRLQRNFSKDVTPGVTSVLELLSTKHRVKVTSLDPEMAPNANVEYDLKRIRGTLHAKLSGYDKAAEFKYVTGLKPNSYEVLTSWKDAAGKNQSEWLNVGKKAFKQLNKALIKGEANFLKISKDAAGDVQIDDAISATSYSTSTEAQRHAGEYRSFSVYSKDGNRGDGVLHSGPTVEYQTISRGKLIGDLGKLQANIDEFGLKDLIRGANKMRNSVRAKLYGNDRLFKKTGRFEIDDNKILRIARGAVNDLRNQGVIGKDGRLNFDEATTINSMLSPEVSGAIIEYGKKFPGRGATADQMERLIVNTYKTLVNDPHYLPRNTSVTYKNVGGTKVEVADSVYAPQGGGFQTGFGREVTPSGRTKFRVRDSSPMDPDDVQFLIDEFGSTPELKDMLKSARERTLSQKRADVNGHYKVFKMAPDIALQKYIGSAARDVVMFSQNPMADKNVLAALQDFRGPNTNVRFPGPTGGMVKGMRASSRPQHAPQSRLPAGGLSLHDLISTEMSALREQLGADAYLPNIMEKHVIPSLLGYRSMESGAAVAMSEWTRAQTLKLANTDLFKSVEKLGGVSERFVRGMRRYGASSPTGSAELGSGVAKLFYGSTIGLNLNTALTNLLQPLHNLHQLGFKNTVRAYGQTIEMMYNYAGERSKLGRNASPAEIEAAMDRSFKRTLTGGVNTNLREVADIGSAWNSVEKAGYGSQLTQPSGGIFELVMKPFQATEMVNRVATANAVLNAAEEGWLAGGRSNRLDPYRAQQDARQAVEMMQFGSSPLNRPLMFYNDYLRNPAIRQFLQFPVRSAVNIIAMPGMIGGERNVLGMEIKNKYGVMGVDAARMLGVSAIGYEVFKNMFDADVSRGLAVGWAPEIDVEKDKKFVLPTPPFAEAMYSGVRAVMSGGDKEVMSDIVPLLIPGGVALSRALGGAPKSEALQALGLQKKFADWSAPDAEGNIPMYDAEGRMLGMYSGADIVLRSLGTDMGRFNNQTEVTKFLLSNRDQMRDIRRQWIASVLGNDMMKAGKIKANYERQFGMPLTVTQQQMKQAVRVREESVSSRTIDSIDKDLKQQYQDIMGASVPNATGTTTFPIEQNAQYVWSNLPKR